MAPQMRDSSVSLTQTEEKCANKSTEEPLQIVWRNVLIFVYLHLAAVYGFYVLCVHAKWATALWGKSAAIYNTYPL